MTPPPRHSLFATCPDAIGIRHSRSAFTMVELVVVIAIILIIVGLAAPAATTMWAQQKQAQTENAIQGLLMTARARALQADGVESGFLAYMDEQGNQHLAPIEKAVATAAEVETLALQLNLDVGQARTAADLAFQDVFIICDEPDQILPAPMRIVPRYVVDGEPTGSNVTYLGFADEELTDNDFNAVAKDQAQRHRNFFTLIFSTDGELLVNRNVLIKDENSNSAKDSLGDRTELHVAPEVAQYFSRVSGQPLEIDPTGSGILVDNLIADPNGDVAINFASVDGLLVYDDSSFKGLAAAEKRPFLVGTGRPIYVGRYTGALVRGPVGQAP